MLLSGLTLSCRSGETTTAPISEKVNYWTLPTGSRIAYICFPARDSSRAIPLIIIHGGPGAYQVSECLKGRGVEWYRKLARSGYNVFLYDQIGSGLSARLTDPRQYTVARHVADLEAIRTVIGGRKFIPVGDSWGSTLAANYMAAHPGMVVKAVFNSPGMIDPSEWSLPASPTPRVYPEFRQWAEKKLVDRELQMLSHVDTLMQTDLQSAYAEAPDSVVDPLLDDFTESILPTTVRRTSLVDGMEFKGMGWWVFTMTNWDALHLKTRPRSVLESDNTPVLIMRGDSDFLPPDIARQYRRTFSNSTYMQVTNAGHFIWLDKPGVYAKTIEDFLAGK